MNTTPRTMKIIIIGIVVIALGLCLYIPSRIERTSTEEVASVNTPESVVGCYVMRADRNVYTLTIHSQEGATVEGRLSFDNFQIDSSSGTFEGTYQAGILRGEYAFTAEGMDSVRELVFKRVNDDFVQGFGPVETTGNREVLTDLSAVTFSPDRTFAAENCL